MGAGGGVCITGVCIEAVVARLCRLGSAFGGCRWLAGGASATWVPAHVSTQPVRLLHHPPSHPRLPSAYRALLAEAVRRAAWHELYCGQAARLGEHMVRFRDKEAARRSAFAAQVGSGCRAGAEGLRPHGGDSRLIQAVEVVVTLCFATSGNGIRARNLVYASDARRPNT